MGISEFLYSQLIFTPAYPDGNCVGQTIIVTGSNCGLGKEAARHFARLGTAKLILAVRNITAGEAARHDILTSTGCDPDCIEVWHLDLFSHGSMKEFARRASKLSRIDALVENAGISTKSWEIVQGHERHITVNVISTFYLALLLLPKLRSTAKELGVQPRVTIVSTEVHSWTKFPQWREATIFEALNDRRGTLLVQPRE